MDAFAICRYLWTAWVVIWVLWALQSKRIQQRESVAARMSYGVIVWASLYLMFFAKHLGDGWRSDVVPYRVWMGWAGVAITALGFAFTLWARYILGSNWSGTVAIKVGHELVRSGPYRWVRHPIYTGMIVATAGTAVALDEWRGGASVVLLWLGFTIKRLKEEQFMRQTFGAQYVEYSQTTGAIFPSLVRRSS
jgi:protein-S-isoprenylcysteine O-methyltransferase Ste14